MKCPSKQTLAGLATGDVRGSVRKELIKHIRGCARCREIMRRYDMILGALSYATVGSGGKVKLEIPKPSPESNRRLEKVVLEEFRRARRSTGVRRTVTLWKKLFEAICEKISFGIPPAPEAGYAFRSTSKVNVAAADGTAGVYAVETVSGDLEIHVDSTVIADRGKKLRLQIGAWRREIVLRKGDARHIGGRIVINEAERNRLRPGARPRVTLAP